MSPDVRNVLWMALISLGILYLDSHRPAEDLFFSAPLQSFQAAR